ncbi:MAG: ribosome maturation factor RimP [Pseudomonadota bacterium]|uniref:Ribosome maturation factor RimP n=1 Tax=Caldimonas aquatica TaxID=376175 RepID=A0ABY6MWD4_9BURK|nr:ribosome maturation factor RimP [Schlegelella aquatica]UZD56317.1 ribosome maturation factor RimP [Schlegelella aquatica]
MSWQGLVERTVAGLGYELVECERSSRGLLRVFIDRLPGDPQGEFITVDDCERVTRQLQYALEVEGVDYERLEVSSPGLDRPLRKAADYQRFAGHEVDITLKLPFQGRKKYRGVLEAEGEGWRLVLSDGKQDQALSFSLDEVREARLVPVIDFKGRRKADPARARADEQEDGGQ